MHLGHQEECIPRGPLYNSRVRNRLRVLDEPNRIVHQKIRIAVTNTHQLSSGTHSGIPGSPSPTPKCGLPSASAEHLLPSRYRLAHSSSGMLESRCTRPVRLQGGRALEMTRGQSLPSSPAPPSGRRSRRRMTFSGLGRAGRGSTSRSRHVAHSRTNLNSSQGWPGAGTALQSPHPKRRTRSSDRSRAWPKNSLNRRRCVSWGPPSPGT
jgi:hypothetical protein